MNTHKRHRLPVDIISYALEVYCRLKPSHRDVENLLAERGIIDIGGAIRLWCIKFSSVSVRRLKRSYGRVCRTERLSPKPNHLKRKTPADGEGLSFGRTRRIRTADLYHVKASRTHQDTFRHAKNSIFFCRENRVAWFFYEIGRASCRERV